VDTNSIRFVGTIAFSSGSAGLLLQSEVLLDSVAHLMVTHPEIGRVQVVGHTDGVGSAGTNLRLSQKRAEQVVARLVRGGVAEARLEARGLGHTQPVDSNATAEGRSRNRRVDLRIDPSPLPSSATPAF
jgi:outer membrane protein OmpA-like peptidoglycan-associated protein